MRLDQDLALGYLLGPLVAHTWGSRETVLSVNTCVLFAHAFHQVSLKVGHTILVRVHLCTK